MQAQICEVGPRDGLQSFSMQLSVEQRLQFIRKLIEAGLSKIEVGSLVPAKYVPEMADSDILYEKVIGEHKAIPKQYFSLLIPNQVALEKAFELKCKSLAFFTATSETFNQKNIKKSVKESIELIDSLISQVLEYNKQKEEDEKILIRTYVSTVFHCPYEGFRNIKNSLQPFEKLFSMSDEISLGDTTGNGEIHQLEELNQEISNYREKIWWHFHDTYQKAEGLARKAINLGYKKFDSSTGGIGGCPFSPGAKGNIATEKLLKIFKDENISFEIDFEKVWKAGKEILDLKK